MKANMPGIIVLLFTALLWQAALAQAQSADPRKPSAAEMVQRLAPPPQISSRSVGPRGISIEGQREKPNTAPSIDLEVNFAYASADLTTDAKIVLDNLGQALADPQLQASRFKIAGHTDAAGGDDYNKALSKRRAQSVADYLVRQHGVTVKRLAVEGYGKAQLLDASNPLSAVNRRVQVVNLGTQE
jgi:outer membrane protein OmpA-like peptidoglycan-associated protein